MSILQCRCKKINDGWEYFYSGDILISKLTHELHTLSFDTGLEDCQGNRIFSGDFLEDHMFMVSYVYYDLASASFKTQKIPYLNETYSCFCVVIGNMWDNVDLFDKANLSTII